MKLLVGTYDRDDLLKQAEDCGLSSSIFVSLTRAAGSLFWEFAKSGTSNPSTISAILLQLGLNKAFSDAFAQVY